MPHVPAFEIGAVFLLIALWMGLSRAREVFPEMLQSVKPLLLVSAVVLLAAAGYQVLPDLYHGWWPGTTATLPPTARKATPSFTRTGAIPASKKITITEVEYILKVAPKPAAASLAAVEEKPPEPAAGAATPVVVTPAEEPAAATTLKSESGGKKIIKTIGRALHLGHRKYEPPAQQ